MDISLCSDFKMIPKRLFFQQLMVEKLLIFEKWIRFLEV